MILNIVLCILIPLLSGQSTQAQPEKIAPKQKTTISSQTGEKKAQTKKKKSKKEHVIPDLEKQYSLCIVVPAYNEEARIKPMLEAYIAFFNNHKMLKTDFLIVPNNCSDNTEKICKNIQKNHKNIEILSLPEGGKGNAVVKGFTLAVSKNKYDLIGFVDADLATQPLYFYELIGHIEQKQSDGAIASRYAKGANVYPPRPFLYKIGGKVFNLFLRKKLSIPFRDTQCGAKIFKPHVLKTILPYMEEKKWAFDLELLYLGVLFGYDITEVPTTWSDAPGSHFDIGDAKVRQEFINSISRVKTRHKELAAQIKQSKKAILQQV
ncbi:glycosyltransferase [bacterium]|nr:glycosyltransferase [bacterium]